MSYARTAARDAAEHDQKCIGLIRDYWRGRGRNETLQLSRVLVTRKIDGHEVTGYEIQSNMINGIPPRDDG